MKCASCGLMVRRAPIRENIGGRVNYYCCPDCFQEELCRRDRPLPDALEAKPRRGERPR